MSLPLLHLLSLTAWLGVLAAEAVLELLPLRKPELYSATSAFHYYIDLLAELPLLIAITVSGVLLLLNAPLDTRLVVKAAAGAWVVSVNLFCVGVVIGRHRGPPDRIPARSRLVHLAIALGSPGFAIALYLGLGYAGWLG